MRALNFVQTTFSKWLVAIIAGAALLVGCEPSVQHRPYGDMKIGLVADLQAPESYLPNLGLLVRHDSGGFSAMSTFCTRDLSHLTRKKSGDSYVWVSQYSASQYSPEGKVVAGPAILDLPYFTLFVDPAFVQEKDGKLIQGSPALYVHMGDEYEVGPKWRLKIAD